MPVTNQNLSNQIDPDHEEGIETKLQDLIKVNPKANLQELKHAATMIHNAYLLTMSEEGQQQTRSKEIVDILETVNKICILDFLTIRLLGFHHLNEGNTESAKRMLTFFIDEFEKYGNDVPEANYASACFFRGICHFKEKNYGDAKEDFLSGMENDSKGDSLDTVAKGAVAAYMTQLEEMEFKFTRTPLQPNVDHEKLAAEYREAKQHTKCMQHIDQAIILKPRSADLYLLRSNVAYEMRKNEEDVSSLSFAIRARLYAAWLANAKIDETTKINGTHALHEGRELFKRLKKLHNLRKEMKEEVDKILNLQEGITSTKNKGEGIEITINLLPIINTIEKFLPHVKASNTLNSIAMTLSHLHKDDLSKITKEECTKIHALVIKPSAIPKNILKKFENKIDAYYKNGRKFEKIIKALDELMVDYPRFISLHVERAKYLLIWGSPHHIQEARKSLEEAYWIYRSKLDTHSPGLRSYHLQMSTLYLCEGQISHSMTQHNEVMRLTEKEGKRATRDQYLALIDEIITLNQRQKTRHPKLFLDWIKLSYMLKNTPEKLTLIQEVGAIIAAAATRSIESTETNNTTHNQNDTALTQTEESPKVADTATASTPVTTPSAIETTTNEDTEAKIIADEKAHARAEAKAAKDLEKAKRKAAKKAKKTRRKERNENREKASNAISDAESDTSDVDTVANNMPIQAATNTGAPEELPNAPANIQSTLSVSISTEEETNTTAQTLQLIPQTIAAPQADSNTIEAQENPPADIQPPQISPEMTVTEVTAAANLSADELTFTQLERDQHKQIIAHRKKIRTQEENISIQGELNTKQQATIAKLEEKLAALERLNSQQQTTLTEQKIEIDNLSLNNNMQSNIILQYTRIFQNHQAIMAASQNLQPQMPAHYAAYPNAPYPSQYPQQGMPTYNRHRFQAINQASMPTIRMLPAHQDTSSSASEAKKYSGNNRGG